VNEKRFNEVVEARCEKIKATLEQKAEEYASERDRLHNFKQASVLLHSTPLKAATGFWMKHIVSITDMVEAPDRWSVSQWEEKIGDAINYLVLMEAIIKESLETR